MSKKIKFLIITSVYSLFIYLVFLSYNAIVPDENIPILTNNKQLIKKVENEFKPNTDSVYEIIEKKNNKKKEESFVPKDEDDSKIVANFVDKKNFFKLQIASFKTKEKSDKVRDSLNKINFSPFEKLKFFVKEVKLSQNETYYRVISEENFTNKTASQICEVIISRKFQCILIKDK
ncbi:MAG: hypothetical protein CMM99_03420 [Rickettsiales bacterium]|nr:hypothetical protein [Rickettsiales bacterium]